MHPTGIMSDGHGEAPGARDTDEPEAPPRPYLYAAEPLTAWRVDIAVLVGVAQDTVPFAY